MTALTAESSSTSRNRGDTMRMGGLVSSGGIVMTDEQGFAMLLIFTKAALNEVWNSSESWAKFRTLKEKAPSVPKVLGASRSPTSAMSASSMRVVWGNGTGGTPFVAGRAPASCHQSRRSNSKGNMGIG